ncbi:MAG: GyrI-like domain-containing protein [Chitinophagaceae bacterium]
MKRILLVISAILVLLLSAIYLLIPGRISLSQSQNLPINRQALYRNLADEKKWLLWWPGVKKEDGAVQSFLLNGFQYKLHDVKVLSLPIDISGKNVSVPAELIIIAINPDSVNVQLNGSIATSYNPITRVKAFFTARKIKKDITTVLQSIGTYYAEIKKQYGYDIQNKSVVDSILMMNFREMNGPPATNDIYALVDELKNYIKQQGAAETGNPMLNIFTKDSIHYLLKVAIPVDKKLPPSGNMSYRWMLGGGNILITEVTGGQKEIEKAYKQILLFISDYNRVAPAIPFESLVTDRRKEPDSSKWVTRIYYPVM